MFHIKLSFPVDTGHYYVDVRRLNSTTWQWADGHTIPHEIGGSVWFIIEPNESGDCASIVFNANTENTGRLRDRPCAGDMVYAVCTI